MEDFNNDFYLQAYPDVRVAIEKGLFKTAQEHWEKFGKKEGRFSKPTKVTKTKETRDLPKVDKLKVAFLVPGMGMGGAERWTLELAVGLKSPEIEVLGVFLAYSGESDPYLLSSLSSELPIYSFKNIQEGDIPSDKITLIESGEESILDKADLVISWGVSNLETYLKIPQTKLISVIHGACQSTESMLSSIKEKVHTFVAVSEFCSTISPQKKTPVIYNGLSLRRMGLTRSREKLREELGLGNYCKGVLYLGRISRDKNITQIARALSQLDSKYKLIVAGNGRDEVEIKKEIHSIIPNRVSFLGRVLNVRNILNACDVYVSASPYEAFPYSLLEALYAELPVVTTPVGPIIELERVYGPLVTQTPIDPTAGELASAIRDAALRGKTIQTEKAKEVVIKNLSLDTMLSKWKDFLLGRVTCLK